MQEWSYNYSGTCITPQDVYLAHHGVLGMKWGVRHNRNKSKYRSKGLASKVAKRANDKVDKGFKDWQKQDAYKKNAINLGLKRNASKMKYELDRSKESKKVYKSDEKNYKKALRKNTTYRKGAIKNEVGKNLSRQYLTEAKKIKKKLTSAPGDKQLQKTYDSFMSKHDIERARARRAPEVAEARSRKKATFKRNMTIGLKTAGATALATVGVAAVRKATGNKDIGLNTEKALKFMKKGKEVFKYVYV